MEKPLRHVVLSVWLLLWCVSVQQAISAGISQRLPNNTLTLPQDPPRIGYQLVNAFGTLTFSQPLCITTPPGETNRIFILEKGGLIQLVTNIAAANPIKSQYMDLRTGLSANGEQGLLGLAFHPNFQANGYFYIYRSVIINFAVYERLSRFQAAPFDSPTASAATEIVLFDQLDLASNHNGGDVHFGNDGYLYITVGDGGNQDDSLNNSQTIRKGFHSGMLRIDVDNLPGNLPAPPPSAISQLTISTNYSVPADNPWVSNSFPFEVNSSVPASSTRTEFLAIGLRNPWRFSIDSATGQIWEGDVGGNIREEVNIIRKGGDYGWAYREGTIPGPKSAQAPGNFASTDPIFEYNHGGATNNGNCIIGGVVYRGTRLSQLTGAYIFADNGLGWIWSLRYDGTIVSDFRNLLQNGSPLQEVGIAAFGTDPLNGDPLLANINSGTIRRLVSTISGSPLPPTLADTGGFSDLTQLTPQTGIVPYDVNVPFWSDNAIKTRWFSVPNTNLSITWNPTNNWSFPTGTVWIKHFELITNYVTQERTRVETRFLVRSPGPPGIYGATYRWGGDQGNATLVEDGGATDQFVITGPGGVTRTQIWRYPSRSDCITCHSTVGGLALGFHTAQLNRNYTYTNFDGATGETDNQLNALAAAGYFSSAISDPARLPALASRDDSSASIEWRARSYLAANCVQCHQPGGLGQGFWDARYFLPTPQAGLIWGLLNNNFGNPDAHVITPHSLANSMLYQRIARNIGNRMPPLDTTVLDTNNMSLIAEWINTVNDPPPPISKNYSLISVGSDWKYNDTGTDLGGTWHSISYDDSLWPHGPAQLGYGDGDEATVVGYGPIDTNKYITTYFRKSFVLDDAAPFTNLTLRLLRDDGAVVYLNDTEVFRSNMPLGPITYTTLASGTIEDPPNTFYPTNVAPNLLITGTNLVAVEIHQVLPSSSDISFDLELTGAVLASPPTLHIEPNPVGDGSALLSWPSSSGLFDLYTTVDLTPPASWIRATNAPTLASGTWTATVSSTDNQTRFYRLQSR